MNQAQKLFVASSSVLCASCQIPTGLVAGNSAIDVVASPSPSSSNEVGSPSPSPSSSNQVVCDPLGPPTGIAGSQNGLLAHLYYSPAGTNQFTDVESYIHNDPVAPADLYFNQLNVPTRSFSEGFSAQDGTVLQDPRTGNTLYEWFALHFETEIQLGRLDTPGRYQFAVLSDDGSIIWLDQGTGFEEFLNNDGTTPTRMKCATSGIDFSWSTNIPMKLDYFQGPRYNIALMLLWREVPEVTTGAKDRASDLADPACGQSGNDEFFLWETPPAQPTAVWLGMLARGWKVLSPENYYLPNAQATTNPCSTPSPSPTASPSIGPTTQPSSQPSTTGTNPTPTATPSPTSTTCSGPLCGGGVLGE